ncbi:MAG: hypothetical protein IKZ82_11835 [Clostridia bacterium]|nr:hypothetical protein [Clostridia bacterium]
MLITYKNPGFEHSISSILLFQEDGTAPFWSEALIHFYPQIKKAKLDSLSAAEKKVYLTQELSCIWNEISSELERKEEAYNAHFIKHHRRIEDALSEAFDIDTRAIFNDLVGNICLNPICPRFLKERYFDIFYKNSERGALGLSLHEIIHYLWFHVWNGHFGDDYFEYETPSLKWILSEAVVESIMSDERLASINPYFPRENGGCVYPYFQNMSICGEPILDTLMRMHRSNGITDYMELSYGYFLKHEAAIRRHIAEGEKTF